MARDHGRRAAPGGQQLPHGALPCPLPCSVIGRFGQLPAGIWVRPGRCPTGAGAVGFTGAHLLSRATARPAPRSGARRAVDVDALSVVHVGQAAAVARHPVRHARPGDRGPRRPGARGVRRARSSCPRPGSRRLVHRLSAHEQWPSICGRGTPPRPRSSCASRRPTRGSPRRSSPSSIAASRPRAGRWLRRGPGAAGWPAARSRLLPASSTRASRRPSVPASAPPRPVTTSSVACSPGSTCSATRARTDASARP